MVYYCFNHIINNDYFQHVNVWLFYLFTSGRVSLVSHTQLQIIVMASEWFSELLKITLLDISGHHIHSYPPFFHDVFAETDITTPIFMVQRARFMVCSKSKTSLQRFENRFQPWKSWSSLSASFWRGKTLFISTYIYISIYLHIYIYSAWFLIDVVLPIAKKTYKLRWVEWIVTYSHLQWKAFVYTQYILVSPRFMAYKRLPTWKNMVTHPDVIGAWAKVADGKRAIIKTRIKCSHPVLDIRNYASGTLGWKMGLSN